MLIGYARVSKADGSQSLDLQHDALRAAGVERDNIYDDLAGTVAKLAMRQPFVLFKGLTFQKLCLPGAFRPGDHHNKMLRPGLCVVHASPQYL
nr:recombinase family protein [Serratia marcescens]